MTTELARTTDVNMDELGRTAKMLMMSGFFDGRGGPDVQMAQIGTKILAGREMGYGPFASVNGIHVIQGKPTIAANLMAAAVKSHPNYNYRVRRMDNDGVEIEFFEHGESLGIESFTMDDAKAAQLTGKDNWKKFPRNMLFARCMSNGVRFRCPDVFNGNAVYVPEELGEDESHDAEYTVSVVEPDDTATITLDTVPSDTAAHLSEPDDNPFDGDGGAVDDAGQLTPDEAAILAEWDGMTLGDVKQWCVNNGYASNIHSAGNALETVKGEVLGDKKARLTADKAEQIRLPYLRNRMAAKAAHAAQNGVAA